MKARVRCWPGGRVVPSFEMAFDCAPLPDDVIEVEDAVSVRVLRRRFDGEGHLHLLCELHDTTTADQWAEAVERIRA